MKTLLLLLLILPISDWPQFRGPTGQGVSDETGLPLSWSENKNVRWKIAIPGKGWSSPVVQGDRIWLTTATEEGKSLRAISIDRNSGAVLQNVEVFRLKSAKLTNPKNSFASPTPIIDGDRIYVHFGSYGTACITNSGEIVWKTRLDYDNGQHGTGGSPTLYDDVLIISCDGNEAQFVVALDKLTGKVRWKKSRQGYQAYSTPLIVKSPGGDQVISPGAFRAIAYDPRNGKELWHVTYGEGFSNVPRPVYGDGLVFICTGFQQATLLAVRPDGKGDVTKSKVEWRLDRGVPLTPSPLLVGNELYLVTDNGIVTCLDAKTGKEHWRVRIGGNHSASPIYADGRIYFLSEEGESVVLAPGQQLKHLATNQLDGRTLASMAVSSGSIFIRSETHLYRVSNQLKDWTQEQCAGAGRSPAPACCSCPTLWMPCQLRHGCGSMPKTFRCGAMINPKAGLLQGTLDMLILKALSLGPLHGYGIIQRIRRMSDEMLTVEQGALYPALYRIELKGWVSAKWGNNETGRKAKFYKLTRAGQKQLRIEEESWDRLALVVAKMREAT